MIELKRLSCCGIKEISGISSLKVEHYPTFIYQLAKKVWGGWNGAFFLFSQATTPISSCHYDPNRPQNPYGEKLKKYIEDNNLGEVTLAAPIAINPNSTNELRVWLWHFDPRRLAEFSGFVPKNSSINDYVDLEDQLIRLNPSDRLPSVQVPPSASVPSVDFNW